MTENLEQTEFGPEPQACQKLKIHKINFIFLKRILWILSFDRLVVWVQIQSAQSYL